MTKKDKKKYTLWGVIAAAIGGLYFGFTKGWFGQAAIIPASPDQKALFDMWNYYGKPMSWQEALTMLKDSQNQELKRVGDGGGYVVLGVNLTDIKMRDLTGKPKFFSGGNPQIKMDYPNITRR